MDQADSVHSTPPTSTSADIALQSPAESAGALETGLAIQQRERETALYDLARLRKEASAEIERLLTFLDHSDEYVMTERELDDDDLDASYPECGSRMFGNPNEDDEDAGDEEPSLASPENHPAVPYSNVGHFGTVTVYGPPGRYRTPDGSQAGWARGDQSDMEGDEHDGREPDEDFAGIGVVL